MKKILFSSVLSLAAAISLNAAVVAVVDGEEIKDTDIAAVLSMQMPGFSVSEVAKIPAEQKKGIIDNVINRKLAIKDAKASGIQKDPEYTKALSELQDNLVLDIYMKKMYDAIKTTDKELKEFYDKNKEQLNQPASVKARHILVADEKAANEIIAELKKLKGEALTTKFSELAKQKSIDKGSAANGGELGWFGQTQMVKPFGDAVFAMAKGAISQKPVKSEFGYHIILKEDSKPAGVIPFDDVKANIEQNVKMQKLQNEIKQKNETLRSKAKIEYK